MTLIGSHHICYYFIFTVLFRQLHTILESKDVENYVEPKQEQVVMRAVFIDCELNDSEGTYSDSEATRFQREELYKHSVLQGCRKKLALTLKLSSVPENNSGDEYIPIEHVFDGSNKKRIRLLNPYILRIRRESPLQSYKLRLIDTVTGIIAQPNSGKSRKAKKVRLQRKLNSMDDNELHDNADAKPKEKCDTGILHSNASSFLDDIPSNSDNQQYDDDPQQQLRHTEHSNKISENARVKRSVCAAYSAIWNREKRNEHNIIVENTVDDDNVPWLAKGQFYQNLNHAPAVSHIVKEKPNLNYDSKYEKIHPRSSENKNPFATSSKGREAFEKQKVANVNLKNSKKLNSPSSYIGTEHITRRNTVNKNNDEMPISNNYNMGETTYSLYAIGKPELWYTVQVQLFEKMSTPEGKAVWNDITNGEIASVSSVEPEWKGPNINIKYGSTEWIPREEFSLPTDSSLCLLVSMKGENTKSSDEDNGSIRKYIVVPMDDIVNIEDESSMRKRDGNYTEHMTESVKGEQSHRRVLVRVSRALLVGSEDDITISSYRSNNFLIMPYRRGHHAQIDLEARADYNELLRVGSSGSLITVVSDNTRRTRSTISVQVTNRGLVAARFKVKTRDCRPELADLFEKSGEQLTTDPILIAPRHTYRYVLELPIEIPLDHVHCSLALVNDEDESVAVREVAIKKGDRCFCVWHCDCVCLNEEPKLLCHEMAESRQVAAGLSPQGRPRHARFACYPDILCVNLSVVVVGVLMALMMLGIIKAFLGLFCPRVANWGLQRLIQVPRKLEKYHECNLSDRPVIYDKEGWPVHPDTMKRNVRLLSKEMEFILNIIFFVVVPSLMLWDAIKWVIYGNASKEVRPSGDEAKKCFSSHDMQMRPLLAERQYRPDDISACADSEQDDTEYVLTQMRRSKESLAKSQRKMIDTEPDPSTARQQRGERNSN
ncbi:unnamed protein product [Chilo suppressalis]|uniref:Generative cell specific-1/HAP2 domain-containing protein n=1 Tax=Chilo suppressalis TaxID=168631 RepID=A0ABN8BBE8_CHISP|nr:unnamed protein product [Chilo suppressalis]